MIKATGAFWGHWNQQALAQGGGLDDWLPMQDHPRIPQEWRWVGTLWSAHSQKGKGAWTLKPSQPGLASSFYHLLYVPLHGDYISHICEVAEYHPPHRGLRVLHEVAALCSGPDLGICPRGINLMISSKPWEEPLPERPVQGRGQLPQHTGLWRYSRCSAAPSSWLRTAWAQSENLSQQFCHLPGRGLRSNPACSGPARWWAPVGTSWLGKQVASHTVTFLNAQVPHKTLWLNTGSWRYMG